VCTALVPAARRHFFTDQFLSDDATIVASDVTPVG
jgi:hypothetical protein